MKKIYYLSFLGIVLFLCNKSFGQLFVQDFSSSSTVSNYVSASSPTNGQFNAIATSGGGVTTSITSGKLRFVRTGANTGIFVRTTDFSPTPSAIIFRFDLAVTGTTTAVTSVGTLQVGSGFSTANSSEANASTYARFTINTTTTDGTFQIRDITNGTNSSNLVGSQSIVWAMNNSGATLNYYAPDGTIESVANDKMDVWAGNTKLFDDVAVQTGTQTITDFKFSVSNGSQTIDFDNLHIDPILNYYSGSSGNLNSLTSWGTATDGTGSNPASFTTNNTLFSVRNQAAAAIASDLTVSGLGTAVVIGDGTNTTQCTVNDNIALSLSSNANLLINTNGTIVFNPGSSLSIGSGSTANFNSKSVTLKSTSGGTARIAQISGTLNNASNVTVERYITAKRAWRLLGVPLTGTGPSIYSSWQESQTYTAGLGTHVTNGQTNNAAGTFDNISSATGAGSILKYSSDALSTPASTNGVNVTDNGGSYFLFVRGDRDPNYLTNTGQAANTTTLRTTGTIGQGTINGVGVLGTTYSLYRNPYPSNIDYHKLIVANGYDVTLGGNAPTLYLWDPNLGSYGAYRTITGTNANPNVTYAPTPNDGSGGSSTYIIPQGASFFAARTTAFNFDESVKSSTSATTNYFRQASVLEQIGVNLSIKKSASDYLLADGVTIMYDASFDNAVTNRDATKMTNFGENLGINRNNQVLAVEERSTITNNDTIFLKLWNTGIKDYRLTINPINFGTGLTAYLLDAFTNTSTPLSLTAGTEYDFSITAATASQAPDRFTIVFRPSTALPVSTSIRAFEKGNAIQVDWNVATEAGVRNYEVEKSADGRNFVPASLVNARENNSSSVNYSWLDVSPLSGNNYYRVKTTKLAGQADYTAIVNVKLGKSETGITVYPNPLKGNLMAIQLNNLDKGNYSFNIYNAASQLIASKQIQHGGGSSSEPIELPNNLAKGVYRLDVISEQKKYTQTIMIQ